MTATRTVRTVLALLVTGCLLALAAGGDGEARTFRRSAPIAQPDALPEGATRPQELKPVDPALVRQAVAAVAAAWNTGVLADVLSDNFVDRQRLLDTLTEVAPRDARIRVLSVQAISTLDQMILPQEDGEDAMVSTVSAVVDLQVEFTDPTTGFQRLTGRNEFIFEVTEPLGQ